MTAHLLEVGPRSVRRLCCGGATIDDEEAERAAFESIDDHIALVDLQPVAVAELWKNVLASIDCGASGRVTVIHPSWWSPARVAVVDEAARVLVGVADIQPRTWLSRRASAAQSRSAVVEIADDIVVLTGTSLTVETRSGEVDADADTVAGSVVAMAPDIPETVVIDAPPTVCGAATLATAISKRLAGSHGVGVVIMDDLLLKKLVGHLNSPVRAAATSHSRTGRLRGPLISAVLLAVAFPGIAAWHHHAEPHSSQHFPTTTVVEGRIAFDVPSQWSKRRIVAGPGSARVQVTSPADPDLAVHATQSRVALTGLAATADFLKGAIDAAPTGVFVDFNPAGQTAGRAAVTYREVRAGHDIRWTVWVDKAVRISIGCQSPRGRAELVSEACDLAVRSAHALD